MKAIVLFSIVLIALIYFSSCEYNPVEPYDPTPKVSIVNPVNNSSVSDSVTVSILVNNINVKRVELFIDHNLVYDAVFEQSTLRILLGLQVVSGRQSAYTSG